MKFITSGLTSPDNGQLATKHYQLKKINKYGQVQTNSR